VGEWSRWSRTAIKSFAMGELEARKLKYPTTGTEAILMGILIEGKKPSSIQLCFPFSLKYISVAVLSIRVSLFGPHVTMMSEFHL
jgi:hypothetical protein